VQGKTQSATSFFWLAWSVTAAEGGGFMHGLDVVEKKRVWLELNLPKGRRSGWT